MKPVVVVAVAEDHQVDVHVHDAGHHRHAVGVNHARARRDSDRRQRAGGDDAVAVDHDRGVVDGRAAEAVDETAAGEDERLRVGRDRGEEHCNDQSTHGGRILT